MVQLCETRAIRAAVEVGTLSVGFKLGLFSSFLDLLLDRKDNKYLIHISILEKTCLFSYGTITGS
jgi:hypothetical protein